MIKRLMAGSLVILILTCLLSACGGAEQPAETTDPSATSATEAETTDDGRDENGFLRDELPDLDYKGASVNILVGDYNEAYAVDIIAEEETGAVYNDAVADATRSVEERLNVKIGFHEENFGWPTTVWTNLNTQLITSGDRTYAFTYGYSITSLALEGMYKNLYESKYIDLEKPWWTKMLNAYYPRDNMIYWLKGDFTTSQIKHAFVLYFNQDLLTNHGVKDDIYDLVLSDKWTLDKMTEIASLGYKDVNGDGAVDIGDQFGLTFGDDNKFRGIPAVFNEPMYSRSSDGSFTFNMDSERMTSIVQKMSSIIKSDYALRPTGNSANAQTVPSVYANYLDRAFTEGRAMFTMCLTTDAMVLQDLCSFTLGMVPFPMFDEDQDGYHTSAQRSASLWIPITTPDFDMASAVVEAYGSQYHRAVMPALYETCMKARYSTDSKMSQMFDIVRDGLIDQMGQTFSGNMKLNVDTFKSPDKWESWTSLMAADKQASQQGVDELIEKLRALK